MKKRFIATLLIAIFAIGIFPFTALAAADMPSSWAQLEVKEAIYRGFVPDELQNDYTKSISRAEFAKVAVFYLAASQNLSVDDFMNIYREKSETLTGNQLERKEPFSDIDDFYINSAYALGVVNGRSNEIFDPDSPITRQEAAVMLLNTYRLFGMYANQEKAHSFRKGEIFQDSDMIAEWAIESAAVMYQFGVMNGINNDIWDPLGYYTREQCFATFLRLQNYWPPIEIYTLLPYDEAIERIYANDDFLSYDVEKFECEKYTVLYIKLGGLPHGNGYSLCIVYRMGGMREVELFNMPHNSRFGTDLDIYDLVVSDDESTLIFKRNFNDKVYEYSVDLATAKLIENE